MMTDSLAVSILEFRIFGADPDICVTMLCTLYLGTFFICSVAAKANTHMVWLQLTTSLKWPYLVVYKIRVHPSVPDNRPDCAGDGMVFIVGF